MARKPHRTPAQFKESTKLHYTTDAKRWCETVALARKWKVPAVIRECIEIVRKNGLLL
jgi:hypothetical protein